MLNYDMANFYEKTVRDWDDAALEDGMLTDTAPSVGIQYCGVGWAMIHPLMQWKLYQYYGDRRLIEEQYATSKRWFDLVASKTPDHIIKGGLSDHEGLEPRPAPQMVTPLYCESARILSDLATILEKEDESKHYADLSDAIRQAWFQQFVDPDTGIVSPDTQASHAFALYLDMLPPEMRATALKHLTDAIAIEKEGHLETGIFGTNYAMDVLSCEGESQLAYDVVTNRDFPGWGYMLDNGATTLWEHWAFSHNTFSHNHPMFGSVSQWFFNWLGGVQPDPDSIGFDHFSLRPQFVDGLEWVNCRYDSIRGPIVCNWKRSGGEVELTIEVPVNATATLSLPESMSPLSETDGVRRLRGNGAGTWYRLQSGDYRFTIEE
jgi:alpha-L-rhamnosidase